MTYFKPTAVEDIPLCCVMELRDNNNCIVCCSQTQQYFIIHLIGDNFRSSDRHQTVIRPSLRKI